MVDNDNVRVSAVRRRDCDRSLGRAEVVIRRQCRLDANSHHVTAVDRRRHRHVVSPVPMCHYQRVSADWRDHGVRLARHSADTQQYRK